MRGRKQTHASFAKGWEPPWSSVRCNTLYNGPTSRNYLSLENWPDKVTSYPSLPAQVLCSVGHWEPVLVGQGDVTSCSIG